MTLTAPLPPQLATLAQGPARRISGADGQEPSWHLWKQAEVNAITLALASQRPLLVRGEPGTGKSQLARAAASAIGWQLHTSALHARSEPQDLLYQFDAVRRLADAQAQRLGKDGFTPEMEKTYWQPQALWKALDWKSALEYGSLRHSEITGANAGTVAAAPAGHVVLIDEIDKAPNDVPNGLLEVLGARGFDVPGIPLRVRMPPGGAWPLIIITTNEERDLPAAFMRRCMVLTHDAEPAGGYHAFLVRHGQAHFGPGRDEADAHMEDAVLAEAAAQLVQDRRNALEAQLPPPGLAEYLDLLYGLHRLAPGHMQEQLRLLRELSDYAFRKHHVEEGGNPQLRQRIPAEPAA